MNYLKILVLLDGENLIQQSKALNKKMDFPKLCRFLANPDEGRWLTDGIVYLPIPPDNDGGVLRWHDSLRHNGLQVVTKRAKRLPDGTIKANIDSLLILDAIELAHVIRPDCLVIGSGDGDFAPLATRIRRLGIRCECASTEKSVAAELKAACQGFIDLKPFFDECESLREDMQR
mgnify:CR=1 FL=1